MWSRASVFAGVMASGACTTVGQYDAVPTGSNMYSLSMTSGIDQREQRHAELARRASLLCASAYQLTFQSERATLCTDACKGSETTVATLSCEAA